MQEFEFLRDRAKEFWEEAIDLKKRKMYNLSAFNLEQACQLWIKYLLGKKVGDYPKTHYFSHLVPELGKAYENDKILDFYNQNILFFDDLEDAYFTSRYFPKTFTENLIEILIKHAGDFIEFTEQLTGEHLKSE